MPYVSIKGVPEQTLNILGYFKISEDEEFMLIKSYDGDESIVDKVDGCRLWVDDINDAMELSHQSDTPDVFQLPGRR